MDNYYQQSSPPPPVVGQPPKTFDWLKWVLIMGAVAFLSSGATYLVLQSRQQQPPLPAEVSTKAGPTPTPDPTANWKTYTNTKYGFSFKYPDIWTYEDSSDLALGEESERLRSGYHILLGDPKVKMSAGGNKTIIAGSIAVHIYNKGNYAFYTDNIDDYHKPLSKTPIRKTIEINDLTVNEVHHEACPTNDDCISVVFKRDGNVFIFDTSVWSERYKDLGTIYQILSTFQFTN